MKKAMLFLIAFQLVAGAVNGQDKQLEKLLQLPTEEIVARFKKHCRGRAVSAIYHQAICSPQHYSRAYELLLADYQKPGISDKERSDALHLLSEGLRDRAEDILFQAMTDLSPHIRIRALLDIRHVLPNPKPVTRQAIRKALYDPNPCIIYEALSYLERFPDLEAGERVMEILSNPPEVKPSEQISIMGNDLSKDDIYKEALGALIEIRYPKTVPLFMNLLNSGKLSVQIKVMQGIGKCGVNLTKEERNKVACDIRLWLSKPSGKMRIVTACTLASLGDSSGTGVIMDHLLRPFIFRDNYKYLCVESLEKLTGKDWQKEIFECFPSPSDLLDDLLDKKKPDPDQKIAEIEAYLKEHGYLTGMPEINYTLSAREEELFSRLFEIGLFKPSGSRRVKGEVRDHTCRRGIASGWLVSQNGLAYMVLDDLHEVQVPVNTEEIDFTAEVQAALNEEKSVRLPPLLFPGDAMKYIFWAAWLNQLGHKDLAGRLFFVIRDELEDEQSIYKAAREEMAWQEFHQAVEAYIDGADEEALVHASRLNERYPELADKFGQGKNLLKELLRRKEQGNFGKITGDFPPELNHWPEEKRIAYLISSLENVDAPQLGTPGGVALGIDKRVQVLIQSGDAAVPPLIDCIEKDQRLTRSMHFWRAYARSRTILSVKDVALTVVMSILKTRFFSPCSTGDNFTSHENREVKEIVRELREYWSVYGKMSLPERMMKVLTDPISSSEKRQEAAKNLSCSEESQIISTMAFADYLPIKPKPKDPMIEKFENPTVAEAILEAMERDLSELDTRKDKEDLYDYYRRNLEDTYIDFLIKLTDKRIVPKLKARCAVAESFRMRRKLAYAILTLGSSEQWETFVQDFISGKISLPKNDRENSSEEDQPGTRDFNDTISHLIRMSLAGNKVSENALYALTSPENKFYTMLFQKICKQYGRENDTWLSHPFCLKILRHGLDNQEDCGLSFKIKYEQLIYKGKNSGRFKGISDDLAKPGLCKDSSQGRYCDLEAMKLTGIVFGLDKYHPLFKDADERLQNIRRFMDTYDGRLRQITPLEHKILDISYSDDYHFLPSIQPLERPATLDDFTAGNAVFSLTPPGRLPDDIKLPAIATLYSENKDSKDRVVVVQIEIDSDGKKHYGVIARHGIYQVSEKEIVEIKTYEQWEAEIGKK